MLARIINSSFVIVLPSCPIPYASSGVGALFSPLG